MWLHAMSLQATRISRYTRCESSNVVSIVSIALIPHRWKLKILNSRAASHDTVPWQPISAEILWRSLAFWWHEHCWYLLNAHWIRQGGWNNCCCGWKLWSSYNTTSHTTGWCYSQGTGRLTDLYWYWDTCGQDASAVGEQLWMDALLERNQDAVNCLVGKIWFIWILDVYAFVKKCYQSNNLIFIFLLNWTRLRWCADILCETQLAVHGWVSGPHHTDR